MEALVIQWSFGGHECVCNHKSVRKPAFYNFKPSIVTALSTASGEMVRYAYRGGE